MADWRRQPQRWRLAQAYSGAHLNVSGQAAACTAARAAPGNTLAYSCCHRVGDWPAACSTLQLAMALLTLLGSWHACRICTVAAVAAIAMAVHALMPAANCCCSSHRPG